MEGTVVIPASALSHQVSEPYVPDPSKPWPLEPVSNAIPEDQPGVYYEPGVQVDYYVGQWDELPNFDELEPVKSDVIPKIYADDHWRIESSNQDGSMEKYWPGFDIITGPNDRVAVVYTGVVETPEYGYWGFATRTNDGSKLYIDGRLVVDEDGSKYMGRGKAECFPGKHHIRVEYFATNEYSFLEVLYRSPLDSQLKNLLSSALSHQVS